MDSSTRSVNISRRTFARRHECSLDWRVDDLELLRESGASVRSSEFPVASDDFDGHKWQVELYYIKDSREFGLILDLRPFRQNVEDIPEESPFSDAICRVGFYDPCNNEVQVIEGRLRRDMCSLRVSEDSIFGNCATKDFMRLKISIRASKWCEFVLPEDYSRANDDIFPRRLLSLFNSELFTDVVIEAPGMKVKAHKCILAAHSPVFEAMFRGDFVEKNESRVFLPDVDEDIARLLFRYMYTLEDPIFVDLTQAARLYEVSDKYGMSGLVNICRSFFLMNASRNDIPDLKNIADTHYDGVLKESLVKLFSTLALQKP